jgi:hypothetical protein
MPTTARSRFPLLLTLAALATLCAPLAAAAQSPAPGGYMQAQPAPIERAPDATPQRTDHPAPAVKTMQPAPGVYVRVNPQGSVTTVSSTADRTELRVDSGIANISVHHPAQNAQILVDLGGGQLDLIKDGMYTFNAVTKTARVLVGEAAAFPNTDANATGKPIKVKEDHAVTFGTGTLHSVEFQLMDARADLLPRPNTDRSDSVRTPYPAYGYGYGYGYGFYGDGYPYYAGDYPYYGWGEPYFGYGYPFGIGLGFGFYGGGFYGGGFRGRGFGGGGFGGRGFHGRR